MIHKLRKTRNTFIRLPWQLTQTLAATGSGKKEETPNAMAEPNHGQDTGLKQSLLLGSRLALQILEDGALGNQPGQRKVYARLALRLLELPPGEEHSRLAYQYRPALEAVFREELQRHLGNQWLERQFGAWQTLVELIGREEIPWAPGMADAHWPKEPELGLRILKAAAEIDRPSDWLVGRLAELIPKVTPGEIGDLLIKRRWSWENLPESRGRGMIRAAKELLFSGSILRVTIDNLEGISLFPVPLHAGESSEKADPAPFSGRWEWRWLFAAEQFEHRPSREGLAALLADFANHHVEDIARQFGGTLSNLAWPLGACIRAAQEGEALGRLARAAEEGKLGDENDWLTAQRRWEESGLTERDLRYESKEGLPFDDRVGEVGFPFLVAAPISLTAKIEPLFELRRIRYSLASPIARGHVADTILSVLGILGAGGNVWQAISGADLLGLARDAEPQWLQLDLLQSLPKRVWDGEEGRRAIELLGRYKRIFHSWWITSRTGQRLERLLRECPQPCGILRLLAAACARGYRLKTKAPILAPAGCEEARYRGAALVIRIAQGILASGEIEPGEVARELAELSQAAPGERLVYDALSVIRKQGLSGPGVERFLVALLQALPERGWRGRAEVLYAMEIQQRRHVSRLSEEV
ncbi:MAG: hypothetical protein BECKG1743D_GA0114223_101102 [Candidatus Kentron sp. G]|nr:MAG: hypothetical protein BECKG1743F_GA0114225_101193 [Candidatus Kentron sp. G]VFM97141.1 MAG: hypothetical protein BECKG1743E_GA0114224_101153 [Candidatus Kentron sp. G]VFM99249.1 MAG: hypothetical protein BECKG1743D_GA0114223_101102 [Candidatus Kentron sp. G]